MSDRNPSWQEVCRRLWGDEWIAPLSEVLGINRRTAERWKAGSSVIPDAVDEMLLVQQATPDDREYGEVLRRIANGETLEQLNAALKLKQDAINRFAAHLEAEDWVASLAARQKVKP
jgi:hypothetical protein